MSKFVIAKTMSIDLKNENYRGILIQMDFPIRYTLYDIIQIIKMYTGYTDRFEWKFINPYDRSKDLSSEKNKDELDKIYFDEYRDITPEIDCMYGSLVMSIGARGYKKYKKVSPTTYQAVGNFPTEDEFSANINIIEMKKKHSKEELKAIDEKLSSFFKNKYKITDEMVNTFFGSQNNLARK